MTLSNFIRIYRRGNVSLQLHCHNGQLDIIVGTNIANRNFIETERIVGFFLNQLVLRVDLSGDPSFSDLLNRVRRVTLDSYVHQDLSFDLLVAELQPERKSSYSPMYQVFFTLHNEPTPGLEATGMTIHPTDLLVDISKFDFAMLIKQTESSLIPTIEFDTDLFDGKTISQLLADFETIMTHVIANPNDRLTQIKRVVRAEQERAAAMDVERLRVITDGKLERLVQL